jgi:dTDP-4-amino-4,6-dideoxygalactose transaminase/RimJ/RimL family protein N-acetyltransferase
MSPTAALTLRPASIDDAQLLLDWANDPAVRAASFDSSPIPLDTHLRWLAGKLAGGETAFFICESDARPVGYARVERRDEHTGELAVSVDQTCRGRGYGKALIALAAAAGSSELGVDRVTARVKRENVASLRAFQAAGFAETTGPPSDPAVLAWRPPDVPHSRPWLGEAEAEAAAAVVRSGRLALGARGAELETRWSQLTGTEDAACVGSGLAGLRLGLLALGVGPGDEVIVPAYSCVALLNAALALGAEPVLADVLREDWTLDPASVADRIGSRTRAIVAVNLFGAPARLSALAGLGVPVLEDCAHGIGGRTDAGPFGGGGAVSIGSFYPTKLIAGGEGGIVATRDASLLDRVRAARDYGDRLPSGLHLNDKMTDVEAAIVLCQLDRLDEIVARRASRAASYGEALAGLEARGHVVLPASDANRLWYRYAIRLMSRSADDICSRLAGLGVRAEQPVWDLRAAPQWRAGLEATAEAFDSVVSLPLYPDLAPDEQERVCAALEEVVG